MSRAAIGSGISGFVQGVADSWLQGMMQLENMKYRRDQLAQQKTQQEFENRISLFNANRDIITPITGGYVRTGGMNRLRGVGGSGLFDPNVKDYDTPGFVGTPIGPNSTVYKRIEEPPTQTQINQSEIDKRETETALVNERATAEQRLYTYKEDGVVKNIIEEIRNLGKKYKPGFRAGTQAAAKSDLKSDIKREAAKVNRNPDYQDAVREDPDMQKRFSDAVYDEAQKINRELKRSDFNISIVDPSDQIDIENFRDRARGLIKNEIGSEGLFEWNLPLVQDFASWENKKVWGALQNEFLGPNTKNWDKEALRFEYQKVLKEFKDDEEHGGTGWLGSRAGKEQSEWSSFAEPTINFDRDKTVENIFAEATEGEGKILRDRQTGKRYIKIDEDLVEYDSLKKTVERNRKQAGMTPEAREYHQLGNIASDYETYRTNRIANEARAEQNRLKFLRTTSGMGQAFYPSGTPFSNPAKLDPNDHLVPDKTTPFGPQEPQEPTQHRYGAFGPRR